MGLVSPRGLLCFGAPRGWLSGGYGWLIAAGCGFVEFIGDVGEWFSDLWMSGTLLGDWNVWLCISCFLQWDLFTRAFFSPVCSSMTA